MKTSLIRYFTFTIFLFIAQNNMAQVGIGTTNPDNSAQLEIKSTDKGLLIPRLTEVQKNGISSPATGLLVYQSDNNTGFYYFNGSTWVSLNSDLDWEINGNNIYNLNSGNVGIGTNNPSNKLHIKGSITTILDDGFEDNSLSPFTTSGNQLWHTTSNATFVNTGTYAAKTKNALDHSQSSTLELSQTLTNSGSISFAYYTSTEATYDKLTFYIDGAAMDSWSGENSYTTISYDLSAGTHTFTWTYSKDGSLNDGSDKVAIDDIKIIIGGSVLTIEDGNQANGRVLVSDASGNAKWSDSSNLDDGDWTLSGNDLTNSNSGKVITTNTVVNESVLIAENTDSDATSTTSYGVHGITHAVDAIGNAGVFGESVTSGNHEIGVKGDYALWGVAVAGIGWSTSVNDIPNTGGSSNQTNDIGVYGGVDFDTGIGVYGYNPNTSGGFAGYFDGDHAITGTKSASVPTSKGNQLLYSMESPEIWFEDFGQAKLINGQVHIDLDNTFNEAVFIDETHPMHVFLQEQGDCNGLYFIPDQDGNGFTVKEKQNGNSNITFSYRITAKRRFYQDFRFGIDPIKPLENNVSKYKYRKPRTNNIDEMKKIIRNAEIEKERKKM